MLLLFSVRVAVCTYLAEGCSFGLLCVSIVKVYQFVRSSFPFGFEGGMLDLFVLVADHCLICLYCIYKPMFADLKFTWLAIQGAHKIPTV